MGRWIGIYDQYSKIWVTYEFQLADVWMIRQVLTDVTVVHHFVQEGKWMGGSRIHAEERDDVGVRESAGGLGLLEESLRVRYQYRFGSIGG